MSLAADFAKLSPTSLADALTRDRVMDIGIRPLWPGMPRLCGTAYTVRCAPGDNLMVHAAIYRAAPGDVIVVEAGDVDYAVAGGNVCAVAQRHGVAGFVVDGLVKIAVYDGRHGSSTFGHTSTFTVSPKNPGLLVIGPNLYHGWKNIGTNDAIIINMPTAMYDHEQPDALDLPWDSEAAQRIIPYRF